MVSNVYLQLEGHIKLLRRIGSEKKAKETERKLGKLKTFLAVLERTRERKLGNKWGEPPVVKRSAGEEEEERGERVREAGRGRRHHRPRRNALRHYVSQHNIIFYTI